MHNKDEGSARDLPKLQYSIEREKKKKTFFLPIFNIINYRPIQKTCYKHIFSCTYFKQKIFLYNSESLPSSAFPVALR